MGIADKRDVKKNPLGRILGPFSVLRFIVERQQREMRIIRRRKKHFLRVRNGMKGKKLVFRWDLREIDERRRRMNSMNVKLLDGGVGDSAQMNQLEKRGSWEESGISSQRTFELFPEHEHSAWSGQEENIFASLVGGIKIIYKSSFRQLFVRASSGFNSWEENLSAAAHESRESFEVNERNIHSL
jgi:hypothetical protein